MQHLIELNMTLLSQSVAFFIFVGICYRMVWPGFIARLDARRKAIHNGLVSAAEAKQTLEEAKVDAGETLKTARMRAEQLVKEADQSKQKLLKQASEEAEKVKQSIVEQGQTVLQASYVKEREQLAQEVAKLVQATTEQILFRLPAEAPSLEWIEKTIAELSVPTV